MTAEKQKRQHSLPNRQLAQAFSFSADDLVANRSGYLTQAQAWSIPLWMRGIFQQMSDFSPFKQKQNKTVDMLCGRAVLTYEQQQIESIFHSDFVEVYKLSINTMQFRLTPSQYRAIGEGLVYRLYYSLETQRIVSLERAISGCSENS